MITTLLVITSGYLLGCFISGYYLVRCFAGQDIRHLGSGNAGARNVGRTFGARAAAITFIADVAKGAAAVGLAMLCGLGAWEVSAAMLAVICGHICPVQLQFQGGKGVATSIGAGLVLAPQVAIATTVVFAIAWVITRRFTPSGLLAITLCPMIAVVLGGSLPAILGLLGVVALILYAHRRDLAQFLAKHRTVPVHPAGHVET